MRGKICLAPVSVGTLVLALACTKQTPNPMAPSAVGLISAAAGPSGETLKATAPSPQSPINSQTVQEPEVTLRIANSTTSFASGLPLTYRFQIFNASNTLVYDVANIVEGAGGSTSHTVTTVLDAEQPYTWQARAEYEGAFGPWSSSARFIAPATDGYLRGSELYDPLINGKTVGTLVGDVTLIPGKGVRFNSQLGYVYYVLPQTLFEGEFSLLVTGMPTNTEGGKTKLFAMAEGFDDIVTNDRRMTVEKRGDPAGIIAWRFISHGDAVDTEGAEREFVEFDENKDYFFQATWRNNFFNLLIREGGVEGRQIYSKGKHFEGRAYDPDPHVIYLGAPIGRTGESGASVDRAIIRQVWVSERPRPSFANK